MNRLSLYLGLILSRSLLTALYFRRIISHASEWVLRYATMYKDECILFLSATIYRFDFSIVLAKDMNVCTLCWKSIHALSNIYRSVVAVCCYFGFGFGVLLFLRICPFVNCNGAIIRCISHNSKNIVLDWFRWVCFFWSPTETIQTQPSAIKTLWKMLKEHIQTTLHNHLT